jgi:hypothetical protein
MRVLFAFAVLLLGTTATASAQSADHADRIRTAATLNQQLVRQIDEGQRVTDVGALNAQAGVALTTAQNLALALNDALELSTTDSERSRASGLLDHTRPVIATIERARQETNLNAAQGQLNQAWGEANEALSEILPITTPAASVPTTLPSTGNLGGAPVATLPLVAGLLLIVGGLLLRTGKPPTKPA